MDEFRDVIRSLLVLSLLVATQASATTVYRTVDSSGNVQYSDRPEGREAQALTIRIQRPAGDQPTRTAAVSASADQSGAEDAADGGPSKKALREEAARRAERRAQNCEIASERLERYLVSHRLYRALPNGEREYLSAAEIDEARANAEADVKEWCD